MKLALAAFLLVVSSILLGGMYTCYTTFSKPVAGSSHFEYAQGMVLKANNEDGVIMELENHYLKTFRPICSNNVSPVWSGLHVAVSYHWASATTPDGHGPTEHGNCYYFDQVRRIY